MDKNKNFALILAGAMVAAAIVGALTAKYGKNIYDNALSLAEKITTDAKQQSHSALPSSSQSCDIKGNVSVNTGERIYHVPGQEFYDATVIRTEYGERWFCSETEARAAGWRRAKN